MTTAIMGLLTGDQQFFCQNMGRMVLKASSSSSSSGCTSSDRELETVDLDNLGFVDRMVGNLKPTDRRFLNLYKVKEKDDMKKKNSVRKEKKRIEEKKFVRRQSIRLSLGLNQINQINQIESGRQSERVSDPRV